MLRVVLFWTFLILLCNCRRINWCKLSCSQEIHSMCLFKTQENIGTCKNIVDSQTPRGRKDILHLHNRYRDDIASGKKKGWPKAANMRQMTWDHYNEMVGLRWAQQCVEGHDKCRRTCNFSHIGQNYGKEGSSTFYPFIKPAFEGWVDEIELVKDPKSIVESFEGGPWGHFTQVVWAWTYKLGCGEIHTMQSGFKTTIIVCNYGPGGNVLGKKVYEAGEPCTKCPTGTRCNAFSYYPHLCALITDDLNPVDIPALNSSQRISSITIITFLVTIIFARDQVY